MVNALVIGGGPAGVFAALRLKQRGISTRILWAQAGAAEFGSGAFDWSDGNAPLGELDPEPRALLELWPKESLLSRREEARFLSETGVSSGHLVGSPWLFDWQRATGGRVAVVDAPEFSFDAREFCRTARQDPWISKARIEIVPVPGVLARLSRWAPTTRLKWATDLDQAPGVFHDGLSVIAQEMGVVAWVFPSCLGLRSTPDELPGLYFGELLSGLTGLEGERYAGIRARILGEQGIESISGRCIHYQVKDGSIHVVLETGASLWTDRLVLATGGFFSRGRYFSSEGKVGERVTSLSEPSGTQSGSTAEERTKLFFARAGRLPVHLLDERIVRVGELVRPASFLDAALAGIHGASQLSS